MKETFEYLQGVDQGKREILSKLENFILVIQDNANKNIKSGKKDIGFSQNSIANSLKSIINEDNEIEKLNGKLKNSITISKLEDLMNTSIWSGDIGDNVILSDDLKHLINKAKK